METIYIPDEKLRLGSFLAVVFKSELEIMHSRGLRTGCLGVSVVKSVQGYMEARHSRSKVQLYIVHNSSVAACALSENRSLG